MLALDMLRGAADAGAQPTLDLNFASGTLDSRVTYSRASSATRVNASGVLEVITSGNPRFTYDPITHAALGLLIEEQRTNLLTYSEDLYNAAWTGIGTSVTANATTAPDGNTTADKVVATATINWHGTRQIAVTLTSGVAATLSVYAKAAEETKVTVSDYVVGTTKVIFDLSAVTAVVSGSDAGLSLSNPTITNVAGGWYRCTVTMTASVAGRTPMIYLRQDTTSYAGDGTSGIYLWGAQLEAGAFATSYIPTTSASVTRAADSATMTGSNFSSWFNAAQGTFVVEYTLPAGYATSANNAYFVGVSNAAAGAFAAIVANGKTVTWDNTTEIDSVASFSAGRSKFAIALTPTTRVICLNGATPVSGAHSGYLLGVSQISIGSGYSNSQVNAPIARLRYYPTALTNAQLQALTT